MQIFKGRDSQQLEKLAAAPSSWRVLNLHNATRLLGGTGGSGQRRFFQTPQLNHALFTKHTLREHERAMFAAPPAVATKILVPLDRSSFAHGAMSIFVGERGYATAIRSWLGLNIAPERGMPLAGTDGGILMQLSQMPSFDAFAISEAFADGASGVSPDYLSFSLIEDGVTRSFILKEVAPLIRIAADNPSPAKIHKFVESIFGRDLGPAAHDFLRSLGLPESRWSAIVPAWKAALRHEAGFAATTARFQEFMRSVAVLNPYGFSERVSRARVEATLEKLTEFGKRVFANLVETAQGFNSARRAAVIGAGRVGELKAYLEELPEVIAGYLSISAIAQHTLSYWEFRTRSVTDGGMPAEPLCRLADDLFDMEAQLSATPFESAREAAASDLRRTLALI